MCVGIPMQVVESGFGFAICEHEGQRVPIDTMLLGGEVPTGTWVMTFLGGAREILPADEAEKVLSALAAVQKAMRGESVDVSEHFPDLVPEAESEADGCSPR
ncbi:MAG: HypC/HybG/HupF family hydrogenase formation chaperone [Planctomycetota bacterium]